MPTVRQLVYRDLLTELTRDWLRVSGIHIDGVEVTQSIQYRSASEHLTDPADRRPDNSVQLVADKAARVRVFVRHLPAAVSGVTGTVTLQKRRLGAWMDMGALAQQWPSTVNAEPSPDYAAERSSAARSLNFIIPAADMRGKLRLKVQVTAPGSTFVAEDFVDVDASLLQTLTLRGIPVEYTGPDLNGNQVQLAAPRLADFQSTAATTLRMYPVAQTPRISLAGLMTWRAPLDGAIVNGQCPASWNALLFWLNLIRVADGNRTDALYYALLPNAMPIGGAGGCGSQGGGVGAGRDGDGMAMAHELGHVLGFSHAPCGLGAGDAGDPDYPAYQPYGMASIGEYGMDISNGSIFPPNVAVDFMSYCAPPWISLHRMSQLLRNQMFDPIWVSGGNEGLPPYLDEQYSGPAVFDRPDPPPPWVGRRIYLRPEPRPVRLIVVTGLLRDNEIDIRSVLRLETGPTASGQRIANTFVELVDANQRVMQRVALRQLTNQASGCGGGCGGGCGHEHEPPSGLVQALLPDVSDVFTMRVVREDTELWSRQAPSTPPDVLNVQAFVEGTMLTVTWQTVASDQYPIERVVRWSADQGERWQTLAINLEQDVAAVPTSVVTTGTILVQVIVSDGFFSGTSEPASVDILPRPPAVAILCPASGATVRTDESVRLCGVATTGDGRTLTGDALHWELDGEPAGTGAEVWAALGDWEGEHTATLKARDGQEEASACVVFFSSCTGRRAYRTHGGSCGPKPE